MISGTPVEGCGAAVVGSVVVTPPVADTKAYAAVDDDDDDVDSFGAERSSHRGIWKGENMVNSFICIKPICTTMASLHSALLDVKLWDDETDMKKLGDFVCFIIP